MQSRRRRRGNGSCGRLPARSSCCLHVKRPRARPRGRPVSASIPNGRGIPVRTRIGHAAWRAPPPVLRPEEGATVGERDDPIQPEAGVGACGVRPGDEPAQTAAGGALRRRGDDRRRRPRDRAGRGEGSPPFATTAGANPRIQFFTNAEFALVTELAEVIWPTDDLGPGRARGGRRLLHRRPARGRLGHGRPLVHAGAVPAAARQRATAGRARWCRATSIGRRCPRSTTTRARPTATGSCRCRPRRSTRS